jgi:outer membrane protein OmpA-like peptidoglycan-associated protein
MAGTATTSESSVDNFGLVPTVDGPLGLFTVASGNTLPRHGWSVEGYADRFGRMPGELVITEYGLNIGFGLTNWAEIYVDDIPDAHIKAGNADELTPLTATGFNTTRAVYSEDFPFASHTEGGEGPFTLGVKFGLVSEDRGDPISVSLNADIDISSRQDFAVLERSGTQNGKANFEFGTSVSKNVSNIFTFDFNATIDIVRSPTLFGGALLDQAKTFTTGGGILIFPHKRIQFMNEYTGEMYYGHSTPTETFGPRDPVDAVWGFRLFPVQQLAIDLGYRYMLNLPELQDRNGFVVKFATVYAPHKAPPVDHPPTVTCTANPTSVYFGSGDTSAVNCPAVSPDNDTLAYTWTASCGSVDGTGPAVRWLSAGVPIGTCTVTAKVDDGHGGTATGSADIQVAAKPKHPPVMSCSADRSSVFIGEKVHITADASSPDGDTLTFTWETNGGQILGTGSAVDLDTTGAAAGNYTVTGRVDDGNGGAADCSVAVQVNAPPPPPQASKLNECLFAPAGSPRVDNVCKRILDDVALRLQNDPKASAVIVGFADPKEMHPDKLGLLRANNAVKYLGEKGIDASRVVTRAGTGQKGAGKENSRIDIIWVPEGATYSQ